MPGPLQLSLDRPRSLKFSPSVRRDELRLIEVDDKLLQFILSDGVSIKGSKHDDAVLVTADKTYALKYVETTNMQLLIAPEPALNLQGGDDDAAECGDQNVCGNVPFSPAGLQTQWKQHQRASSVPPVLVAATCRAHIEVMETAPRLEQLYTMLQRHPYRGEEEEEQYAATAATSAFFTQQPGAVGYTFTQLLARVQASAEQLLAGLREMSAVELRTGRWRLVDETFLGNLLELVILSIQQEGLPLDAVPLSKVQDALAPEGYLPEVVRHCLHLYGTPADPLEASTSGETWSLDLDKVCSHYGRKTLRSRPSWVPRELTAAWTAAVPDALRHLPRMELLRGEVLTLGAGSEARLHAFSARSLPRDPSARFAALFEHRARWHWTDLEPYICNLKVPGQSAEALLLKYARISQATSTQPATYTAR